MNNYWPFLIIPLIAVGTLNLREAPAVAGVWESASTHCVALASGRSVEISVT